MLPYGGSPVCPRCSKSVYAAEQAMGPGRKLYHKFCLTCTSCNKRLDPGSLVEHNEDPYCKNCHTKSFGTKDLRSANLPHREESLLPQTTGTSRSPPASPPRKEPLSPQFTGSFWSTAPVGRHTTGSNGSYTVGARAGRGNSGLVLQPTRSLGSISSPVASPTTSSPPLPVEADTTVRARGATTSTGLEQVMEDAEDETDNEDAAVDRLLGSPTEMRSPSPEQPSNTIKRLSQSRLPASPAQPISTGPPRTPFFNSSTIGRGGNGFSPYNGQGDSGMSPLVATPTGTRYGRALDGGMGGPVKSHTTGTPSRWGAQTPSCSKCGKSVFFAEQVKAIGKLWHRGCLRCTQCNTNLATGRVNEHDEAPYCARCYTKVHGPAGSGYALLGKAGG